MSSAKRLHATSESDRENAYHHFYFQCILNDLEQELEVKGASGIDIGMGKLFLLLYADDIVIRGMFEMNCLLSSSSISTWGTIKTNTYLYRAIQYLHNGV